MQAYELSYWERETFLENNDVIIIGSGIVGLSAALRMKELQPNLKVTVLERGVFPSGASTRNAGFACFGSASELLADSEKNGTQKMLDLVERRLRGLTRLRERIGDQTMDFALCGSYELFDENKESITLFKKCQDAIAQLNQQLAPIVGEKQVFRQADDAIANFGFRQTSHLIFNKAEGQIHTGKMMHKLIYLAQTKGVNIINNIGVVEITQDNEKVYLSTTLGYTLHAPKVLVATNGFAIRLLPHLSIQPARNQVLITKPIQNLRVCGTFHYEEGYYYFRNVGDRILLGGGRNLDPEGETTDLFGLTPRIQMRLQQLLSEVILPKISYEVDSWWSGILGVGIEKKPIVEMLSPRLGVAVRMGGMGVAIGSLVGEEGAEMLLNA